jgi:hypothetical protein
MEPNSPIGEKQGSTPTAVYSIIGAGGDCFDVKLGAAATAADAQELVAKETGFSKFCQQLFVQGRDTPLQRSELLAELSTAELFLVTSEVIKMRLTPSVPSGGLRVRRTKSLSSAQVGSIHWSCPTLEVLSIEDGWAKISAAEHGRLEKSFKYKKHDEHTEGFCAVTIRGNKLLMVID